MEEERWREAEVRGRGGSGEVGSALADSGINHVTLPVDRER